MRLLSFFKKRFLSTLLLCLSTLLISCGYSTESEVWKTPDDMVLLPNKYDFDIYTGRYCTSLWSGNRIYSSYTLRLFDLDDSFRVINDSIPKYDHKNGGELHPGIGTLISMNFNSNKTKIIGVQTQYPNVSLGDIVEVDLVSFTVTKIGDTGIQASNAAYLSDDSILYYSYGSYSDINLTPPDAGYYILIRSTGKKIFLFPQISTLGPGEVLNGFDIHPNHSKLLIPSTGYDRAPIIYEYDLKTNRRDTLFTAFDTPSSRWCLYLRYNHDATKILYSAYPTKVLSAGTKVYDESEIGIIDRLTLNKRILQTNPYKNTYAICLFPNWSPDERNIVYGSSPISTGDAGGVSGQYRATILKAAQ